MLQLHSFLVSVLSLASPPSLFPYQRSGVERLVNDRRVLLADEMGLGKTVQAAAALNALLRDGELRPDARVLVICPKSVLGVWSEELETWLDPNADLEVRIATAGTSPETESSGIIQLINYDICHKHKDMLQSAEFDVLICDEAHYLKSPDTKRTRAILGDDEDGQGGIKSRYLWLLTGTPIMNRPIELHPLLRALDRGGWEALDGFIERYCDPRRGRWGVDAKGASNLGELSERLKPIMVRRYKSDVLADLPPKLRSCINLDGSDAARRERDMVAEMMGMGVSSSDDWYGGDDGAVGNDFDLETFGAAASSLSKYLPGVNPADLKDKKLLGTLASIRKQTALLKLRPAVQLLKDATLSHKVVVFAHHRELIKELVAEFGSACVHIIGGMSIESRSDAVRRFQRDNDVRLFVGSIRAAGVGVTLTASSHVVFLELDWSPAIMAQAEDRCHRVGQQDSVQVQYYVFKGTIDEWIARQLISKQVNIDRVMPDSAASETNGYTLDFGKHKGVRIEDLPQDYLSFIIEKNNGTIWRKRPELWRALARSGLVRDEPPPERAAVEEEEIIEDSQNEEVQVEYSFDFGKHQGMEWNNAPLSYRDWILRNSVWRNRSKLREALTAAGLVEQGNDG